MARTRKKPPHNYGRKPLYKAHFDPASDAKTCESCASYKPLTAFRRIEARGNGPDAYSGICKECLRPKNEDAPSGMPLLPSPDTLASASEEECEQIFMGLRWPDGVCCPRCSGAEKQYRKNGSNKTGVLGHWVCGVCRYNYGLTSGTPFSSRKLPLRTILAMISTIQRNGREIVIRRVAEEFGIEYKTAYTLAGKAHEFLNGGAESVSLFRGYWQTSGHSAPRKNLSLKLSPRTCAQCGKTKPPDAFGLKSGSAGAWGLRVSVCRDCVRAKGTAAIREAWAERKAADADVEIIERPVADILAASPRSAFLNRSNWTGQNKYDLRVLCEAAVTAESAARALSRSPQAVAWYARDLGLALPVDWRKLIAPKRLYVPAAPRIRYSYPYAPRATPSNADLLRINDLVPRAFPEHMRADICQSVMLALYEGEVTLAEVEANSNRMSWFVKRWRKEQTPYQEVSIEGVRHEDKRSYEEIAASLKTESVLAMRDELRNAWSAWQPFANATQEDDVFRRELAAVRLHEHAAGNLISRDEVPTLLEGRGTSAVHYLRQSFAADEHIKVPLHARQRAMERYGISLDRDRARALLKLCASRRPDVQQPDGAEIHVLRGSGVTMPVVYYRDENRIATILPPEWQRPDNRPDISRQTPSQTANSVTHRLATSIT